MWKQVLSVLACWLIAVAPVYPCLWDSDTLRMERLRFPGALELIAGKFLRHSDAYHHWRIDDRRAKLQVTPDDLALVDDVAVSLEKLGQTAEAIALMQTIEAKEPDRYETLANLGTFLIHHGELEAGLAYLERAVVINPDAHFGREIYQILLVKYVLARRAEQGLVLPLDNGHDGQFNGFAAFILSQPGEPSDQQVDLEGAIKGCLGMMRFGNYDHPILLEALGDLLSAGPRLQDQRLAARAYLSASYGVTDAAAQQAYRESATRALFTQTDEPFSHQELSLETVEERLQAERAEAKLWFAEITRQEAAWVAAGVDLDVAYAEAYPEEPRIIVSDVSVNAVMHFLQQVWKHLGVWLIAMFAAFFLVFERWRRGRQQCTGG